MEGGSGGGGKEGGEGGRDGEGKGSILSPEMAEPDQRARHTLGNETPLLP